jgi:steroid delta-isomerase-like uncharacterized protein
MSQAKAVVERFYGAIPGADYKTLKDCFAPDCMTVTPNGAVNNDQHEQMLQMFKAALPDAHMKVAHLVEAGEWVIVEGHFCGTHEKDLVTPEGAIPAKGKKLELPYADFFRIRDGKIQEHRVYWDQMTMLAQLGAVPGK